MVDDINNPETEGLASEPKPKPAILAFLSTRNGRLVVGGVALFLVLVALGAVAFFFLLNTGSDVTTTTATTKQASQTTTVTAPPVNPPEAPLKDTFTFRNIFAPTVHPATDEESAETSSSSEASSEATSGASSQKDVLVLESIATDSGEKVATFTWNGTTYTVKEGDVIDSSPWKVLEIYSDSVLLQYGDTTVTLSVGQGYAASSEPISK